MDRENFEWTEDLLWQLLDKKDFASFNKKDQFDWSGLMAACMFDPKLVSELVKHPEINPNIKDDEGQTPLIKACDELPEIVNELLKHSGININLQNDFGDTALMAACYGNVELIPELLNYSHSTVDVKITNMDGQTAFDILAEDLDINSDYYKMLENHKEKKSSRKTI